MNFLSAAACLNLVTRCVHYRTLLARGTHTFFVFFFWNVSGKRSHLFYLFLTIYIWQPLNKIFYADNFVNQLRTCNLCVWSDHYSKIILRNQNALQYAYFYFTNEQERPRKGRRWEERDWKKLKGKQFKILHHPPMRVS